MPSYEVDLPDENRTIRADNGLFNVPELQDTFNPWASFAVAVMDDRDGTLYDLFPRGERVDIRLASGLQTLDVLTVNNGDTYTINNGDTETYHTAEVGGDLDVGGNLDVAELDFDTRLQGFVVERRELEDQGADQLEIEVYSLDQLLRGDKVSQSTDEVSISTALENIITNDTPVAWNAANVDIVEDRVLTRELRGERVENALLYLSFASGNEHLGVNSTREFFFRPEEQQAAPRDIESDEWFYADVPEEGKEVINECRVWYNDGESKVTVTNGADKLALQDSLGLDDPYSTVKEVSRPGITEFADAKEVGNQLLDDRATATPITVTTFGLESAAPGDVITVDIPVKGIDSVDYEIAAVRYSWGDDETDLTLVEVTGYQDELLVRVVDALERVELGGINRDAGENRVTDTRVEAEIDITGDIDGESFSATRFTNSGRNRVRDAWNGGSPITITDVVIGDDSSGLKRSNSALGNQTNSGSASTSLDGDTGVSFSGSAGRGVNQTTEAGIIDENGDLIARGVVADGSGEATVDVTVSVTVSDNGELTRGVFTDAGQTAVRDIIADNSPAAPTQYAYGSSGSTPQVTDTTLGNQVDIRNIVEIIYDQADSTSEFNTIFNSVLSDTDPVVIQNGGLELAQTGWFQEAETAPGGNGSVTRTDFSDGAGTSATDSNDDVFFQFTPDYQIPSGDVGLAARVDADGTHPTFELVVAGETVATVGSDTVSSLGWVGTGFSGISSDLTAGVQVEARLDVTGSSSSPLEIDGLFAFDARQSYTFDNSVHQNDGYLDGPELYPSSHSVEWTSSGIRRFDAASLSSTWNDVSGNQFVSASNDGSNFTRVDNSSSFDIQFGSYGETLTTRFGLSRWPVGSGAQSATPRFGYNGSVVDEFTLTVDERGIYPFGLGVEEVESVVPAGTVTGETLREAGQLDSNDELLTHCVFAAFDVVDGDMQVRSSEKTAFDPQ